MGANYVAPDKLYQITDNHNITDGKDNDNSQSYETTWKIISVITLLVKKSPPQTHHDNPHCIHLENNIYALKLKGQVTM